jgi:hypothetical protein
MKNWIVLLLMVLIPASIFAQSEKEDENTDKKPEIIRPWYISIVPQFTITKGFRFDIERRFPNSVSAIVLSPRIYLGNIGTESFLNNSVDTEFTISGFGAELGHKLYLDKATNGMRLWYLGYGIFYNSVSMDYQNQDWVEFIGVDGNPYLSLQEADQKLKINQVGGNVVIGALFWVDNRIYLDMQLGLGAKYADIDDSSSTDAQKDSFSDGVFNFGYTGTYPTGIIKVGIQF